MENEQKMGHQQSGQDQVETIPNAASIERVGIDLAIFIYVEKLEQLVSCVVPMAATCAAWLQSPAVYRSIKGLQPGPLADFSSIEQLNHLRWDR